MNNAISNNNVDGAGLSMMHVKGRDSRNQITEQLGEIISAVIISKTDSQTTLQAKGDLTFKAENSKISGQVGEEIYFQIMESGKNGTYLKQIDNPFLKVITQEAAAQSGTNIKELFERSNFIKEENILKGDNELQEEQLRQARTLAKIKRDMAFGYNNVNSNAVAELIKHGISLDKMDIKVITTAIKEIKATHRPDTNGSTAPASLKSNEEIEKFLTDKDLPVTPDNVRAIKAVVDRFSEIRHPDEAAMKQLIRDGGQLSLMELYVSKYSTKEDAAPQKELQPEQLTELMTDAERIMKQAGLEITKETLKAAEYLLKNDLPVTGENVEKLLFLKDIHKNLKLEDLLNKAVENIKSEKDPLDIPLTAQTAAAPTVNSVLNEKYGELMKFLPSIRLETVELLLKKQMPVTLDNLRHAQLEGERYSEKRTERNSNFSATQEDTEVTTVTAKRQIYEIQLRLTSEAAYRLAGKNIDINNMPVKEALEAIKGIEKEVYAGNLRMMGAVPSEKNISEMSELFTKLRQIRPVMESVYGGIIQKPDFTITSLSQSAEAARALAGYEIFETKPNARYGDSFSSVRDEMGPLLERLGMEPIEQNIRAGIILSKNNIDITESNLEKINEIDGKISAILNRLHPNIAASMIRDGLNPAQMSADQVISYIDRFQEEYGDNLREKIPELIAEMDASKTLTPEERTAVIAVYRMLNTIERNGGVGLGMSLGYGTDSELGEIFEGAKQYKRSKSGSGEKDFQVDDAFGRLEKLKGGEDNVRELLERILKGQNRKQESYITKGLERMREAFKASGETLEYMVRNEIPATPENIVSTRQLIKDKYFIGRSLNSLEDEAKESAEIMDEDLTPLKDGAEPEDILEELSGRLGDVLDKTDGLELAEKLMLLRNAIKVQNYVRRKNENEVRLPVRINGIISELNMYIMNKDAAGSNNFSILMAFNTPNMGEITAKLNIDNGRTTVELKSESQEESTELLNRDITELTESLNREPEQGEKSNSKTRTQKLAYIVSNVLKYIATCG